MEEMVICKKGKDMISCGFKLKTDGLKHLNNQHREELEQIFSQFQAPAGFLAKDKPCRYNSLRHLDGKHDLFDALLTLKSKGSSTISKNLAKNYTRKYSKKHKKTTRKNKSNSNI